MDVRLVMFRADGQRRDFPMEPGRIVVGRKNDCDIRVPVTEVSRHHCEFAVDGRNIQLRDLGSANGTFVNNKRITQAKLEPGDHVIIGPVVFTLQIEGVPSDIRPVKTRLKRQQQAPAGKSVGGAALRGADSSADEELDPISALEALASSADQTAIDPFEEDELK